MRLCESWKYLFNATADVQIVFVWMQTDGDRDSGVAEVSKGL